MEEKIKNRGWVKNVAIIFLSVLLVLTLFSNTIMNRSLPEVAAQYAQSGSITTRVRGTGTVEANENYEVKAKDSRKVQSVAVKVGQEVAVGDPLFILAAGDSTELETAKNALSELQYNYQKALLSAADLNYAKENRDITLAREALEEAVAERDKLVYSDPELQAAEAEVDAIERDIDSLETRIVGLETRVNRAQTDLDALGGRDEGSDGTALNSALQAARAALDRAQADLNTARLRYQELYDVLALIAAYFRSQPGAPGYGLDIYMAAKAAEYAPLGTGTPPTDGEKTAAGLTTLTNVDEDTAPDYVLVTDENSLTVRYAKADLAGAYEAIQGANAAVSDAQRAYDSARDAYDDASSPGNVREYDRLNNILQDAKEDLSEAQNDLKALGTALEKANTRLTKLETQKTDYKTAADAAKTAERTLEDLIFAFQEQQSSDEKDQSLAALDLSRMRQQIADAQEDVNELSVSSEGGELLSEVDGIVRAVNITAGNDSDPSVPLAEIEVTGRGYSVSFSVSTDQASKVKTGDLAEVSGGWWWGGPEITARLVAITPDQQEPMRRRMLKFDVSGGVEPGSQLTLSIGQRSQDYETIVPNSAIRTDTNGSFVLMVTVKSSPLGNRFIATRVDVQELAKDDLNTAIAGGITYSDMVITTSTTPLTSGMLVRMAEG